MTHSITNLGAIAIVLMALQACGEDPSFLELYDGKATPRKSTEGSLSSADAVGSGAVDLDGDGVPDDYNGDGIDDDLDNDGVPDDLNGNGIPDYQEGDMAGGSNGNGTGSGPGTGTMPGAGNGSTPTYNIPGAGDSDLSALHQCLSKWRNLPFGTTITNYRKISASVIIGGSGVAVSDTLRTTEPFLLLITAGVNVNSQVEYDLLNPNGYYCIKVNVNVNSKLNVNLHCNARLADNLVDVNVGSKTSGGSTAGVGVNVNSDVTVKAIRPFGDECVR